MSMPSERSKLSRSARVAQRERDARRREVVDDVVEPEEPADHGELDPQRRAPVAAAQHAPPSRERRRCRRRPRPLDGLIA